MSRKLAVLAAVAGLALSSCGEKVDYSGMSAKTMFEKAESMAAGSRDFSKKNAIEMLKELQLRHPFSPYAPTASLKTADINFSRERFRSASEQYSKFLADNPNHDRREYALWRLSKSFYNLKKSPDRDQDPCKKTIYWSQALLSYHPETQYAEEAAEQIRGCAAVLAQSELKIGEFYLKRGHTEAARRRFAYLAENFPETEEAKQAAEMMSDLPPPPEQ